MVRFFGWLGKFHILVIHFPIALLTAAAMAELVALFRGIQVPLTAVRLAVWLGAVAAMVAVPLGWLHADVGGLGGSTGSVLALHRWLGTITGLWSLGVFLVSERDSYRGRRSVLFRMVLAGGAALVIVTAHLGGTMVHGDQFFEL
jgi:uncharacterized membrane protein